MKIKEKRNLDKETKKRIKTLTITILLIIVLISGFSYAFISLNYTSERVENITNCFDITMTDEGAINLTNAIPTKDTIGVNFTPYTYTITNTCNTDAFYETTINILSPSVVADASKVRVALYGDGYLTPSTLSTLRTGEVTANFENPLTDSIANYVVDDGYLPANTTKTFNLVTWIGHDVKEFNNQFKTQLLVTGIAKEADTLTDLSGGATIVQNSTITKDYDYTKTTTDGLYYLTRNSDESMFYYRGNVANNNITFANKDWKIVRINKDGSIKLVLNESIDTSTYGTNPSLNDSNIQEKLTTWYNNNLSSFEQYIVEDKYCTDNATYKKDNQTYYDAYKRVVTNNKPQVGCTNTINSKIGVLSADEVMLSNAVYDSTNKTSYLDSTTQTWTLTPAHGTLNMFAYGNTKQLSIVESTETLGIRPTITITKDAVIAGQGTTSNKYTVTGLFTNKPEAYDDTTAPSIELARVTNTWTNTDKKMEIAAFDENYGSEISSYIVKTTNETPSSNDTNWKSMSDNKITTEERYETGTYYVWVKDKSNNISEPKTVTVDKIDKIAPSCTLTYTALEEGYRLQIAGADNNKLHAQAYSFDGETYQELSIKIVTGVGNKTAYIKDIAGNIGTCNVKLPTLDTSGANTPELLSNMIPVYYDGNTWRKADSNNAEETYQWYNYDEKMWANAVTVSSTNRDTYINAPEGTEIPMSQINSMWVWIPRYTYTYLNTNTPQEIQISFEEGTASSGTITCTDNVSGSGTTSQTCTDRNTTSLVAGTSTYTHPAFDFGGTPLEGFWMGKFENSINGTNLTSASTAEHEITIKPNLASLKYKAVSYLFTDIRQMEKYNNIYGFEQTNQTTFTLTGELTGDNNNIDTHMLKNIEWGAVAYLSHSKYGINKEVAINSYRTGTSSSTYAYKTGCGPQSATSTSSGTICNAYNTTLGQSASTTGNVYGVYDMSGGVYDYVMGNMVDSSGNFYPSNAKQWSSTTKPLAKYYDSYTYDGTGNTTYTRGRLGDATLEMAPTGTSGNWYSDSALFVYSSYSWFQRGGSYGQGVYAGAFYFYFSNGAAYHYYGSRASLCVLD